MSFENKTWKMAWKGYPQICENIVCVYLLAMTVLFPFYTTDHYFHILRDRTSFFMWTTVRMSALVLLITLFYIIRYLKEPDNEHLSIRPQSLLNTSRINPADKLLFLFLMVCVVSTICSDYPAEAFLGIRGRYQGSLLWILYGTAFFLIRIFLKPEGKSLNLFMGSGIVLSLWGIADYIGMDVFGWLNEIQEGQRGYFTSAFGNINTYTAGISIFLALAGIGLIKRTNQLSKTTVLPCICYAAAFVLFSISMITGQSDNAVIGIAAFFLVSPFIASKTKSGFCGYLILSALFLLSLVAVYILNKIMWNPYINPGGGILLRLCTGKAAIYCYLVTAFLLLTAALISLRRCHQKTQSPDWSNQMPHRQKAAAAWGTILFLGFCGLTLILLDANFWHPNRYPFYQKYLVFNDSWGTHRGMCWRIAIEEYRQFPLWQKLIGSGPETFGIVVKATRYQEMLAISGQTFDSPHNEVLQYLFTTGIIGALSYYGFLAYGCIRGFISDNGLKEAAAAAVVVYTAVSFVNISVPITQPYIIILMAFILSSQRYCD